MFKKPQLKKNIMFYLIKYFKFLETKDWIDSLLAAFSLPKKLKLKVKFIGPPSYLNTEQ